MQHEMPSLNCSHTTHAIPGWLHSSTRCIEQGRRMKWLPSGTQLETSSIEGHRKWTSCNEDVWCRFKRKMVALADVSRETRDLTDR